MKIELKQVSEAEKEILANLLEKYNYEFSQYDKRKFGNDGLFGYEYLPCYFTDDDRFAYFIMVDNELAGFALINKYPECDRPIDWSMAEFFVAYNFRRTGVATKAVDMIFDKHKGLWHIKYHKKNEASIVLWTNVARKYSNGTYELITGTEPYDDGTESQVLFFEVK